MILRLNSMACYRQGWPAYLGIFLVALGLRLGYEALVGNAALENADSPAYEDLATKIALLQPYQTERSAGPGGFPPDLQRPPGYPAFLAAINLPARTVSRHWTSIAQCFISAAFATVLAWLLGRMSPPGVGLLAGCLYATEWVTIVYTPMLISEPIYTVTLAMAVFTFALALSRQSNPLSLAAGLLLGLAAVVKPAAQAIMVAFLVAWLCSKARRSAPLFLITYLACVTPWMMRNQHKYGDFTLSEMSTVDLYFYIAKGSLHAYPPGDLEGSRINADVDALNREWLSSTLSPTQRSRRMKQEAAATIAGHWPAVLRQSAIGLLRTSLGTASITAAHSLDVPPGRVSRILLNVLPGIQILLLWGLAIAGCFAGFALRREIRILLAASIICVLLPAASTLAQSRFRVPAIPEICVLAAAGAAALGRRMGPTKYRQELARTLLSLSDL